MISFFQLKISIDISSLRWLINFRQNAEGTSDLTILSNIKEACVTIIAIPSHENRFSFLIWPRI